MHFSKPPLGTPLDWGNPLNDETVMALAMNEGHGDKVQDLSMNGNHGTLTNFAFPPTVSSGWNPGQTGIGLNFDGANDNIDCGNKHTLMPEFTALTVACGFKKDVDHVGALIGIGDTDSTKNDFSMFLYTNNRLYFDVGNGVASGRAYFPIGTVNTGWNIAVGTYDGGRVRLYLNGVLSSLSSALTGNIAWSGNNLLIGSRPAGNYVNGAIDQPRILYNRAWTAKEVRDYAINPWQVYLDE